MPTAYRFLFVVSMAALVVAGAGCQKYKDSPKSSRSTSSDRADQSPKDVYKDAVELEFPDNAAKKTASEAEKVLDDVFGSIKLTSFLSDFLGAGSISAEYTIAREAEAADINKMLEAVKRRGYTVSQSGVFDGQATVIAEGSKGTLMISFKVGEQKVAAVTGQPVAQY